MAETSLTYMHNDALSVRTLPSTSSRKSESKQGTLNEEVLSIPLDAKIFMQPMNRFDFRPAQGQEAAHIMRRATLNERTPPISRSSSTCRFGRYSKDRLECFVHHMKRATDPSCHAKGLAMYM